MASIDQIAKISEFFPKLPQIKTSLNYQIDEMPDKIVLTSSDFPYTTSLEANEMADVMYSVTFTRIQIFLSISQLRYHTLSGGWAGGLGKRDFGRK